MLETLKTLFRFFPFVIAWVPLITKLVRVIDKFHSDAPSEQKKTLAMEFARAALERAGLRSERLLLAIGNLVDLIVNLLHARRELTPGPAVRTPLSSVGVSAAELAVEVDPAVAKYLALKQRKLVGNAHDARLDELER